MFNVLCHKIKPNHGWSYVYSPDSIKKNKQTINPISKKDKCFQYSVTVLLSDEEIGKHTEIITKAKPFISKYKWEGINFLLEKDIGKKIKKNNVTTALNVLYAKKEKMYPAYVLKNYSNCEKQVILSIIPNGEGPWHLGGKAFSALLRKIISKIMVIFIVWIVSIPLEYKTNLNHIKKHE